MSTVLAVVSSGWPSQRVAAPVVGDFLGHLFQLLAGARIGGQCHQPVAGLGDAEPLELAPYGGGRGGGHTGQQVSGEPAARISGAANRVANADDCR
jgi:hypothetical protein